MPLGIEKLLYRNVLVLFCQRNKGEEGLFSDKKGCLRPPLMATCEGWRGPLKEDKSDKSQCLLGMRLCPATVPVTQCSESICMWWTWGLELVLRHWNNWGTIGSSLTSSEEPWSGVPGPPSVWFPAHCCWAWGGPPDLVGNV